MSESVILRAVTDADAEQLAEIFLTSRKTAMPWLAQPHTDDETRWWHINVLLPRGTVVVAERHGNVVGFAEPSDGWLHALYIAPSAQGSGVGSALFEHSMTLQPGGFDLWVFQRNTRALDFYARYGCAEVRRTDGSETKSTSPTSSCAGRPATEGARKVCRGGATSDANAPPGSSPGRRRSRRARQTSRNIAPGLGVSSRLVMAV